MHVTAELSMETSPWRRPHAPQHKVTHVRRSVRTHDWAGLGSCVV